MYSIRNIWSCKILIMDIDRAIAPRALAIHPFLGTVCGAVSTLKAEEQSATAIGLLKQEP